MLYSIKLLNPNYFTYLLVAILNRKLSNYGCGQEDRILLEEFDILFYRIELEQVCKGECKKKLFKFTSKCLKFLLLGI